jgi:hypothetical protein
VWLLTKMLLRPSCFSHRRWAICQCFIFKCHCSLRALGKAPAFFIVDPILSDNFFNPVTFCNKFIRHWH